MRDLIEIARDIWKSPGEFLGDLIGAICLFGLLVAGLFGVLIYG